MIIKIPFKTPTVNHLYGRHSKGFMFIKQEAKDLKEEIKKIVHDSLPFVCPNLNDGLKIEVEIHENWYSKKHQVLRKDIANREKFLIDSVFDALGIDDKYIFEHRLIKVQDQEEYSLIKIMGVKQMAEDEEEKKEESAEEETEEKADDEDSEDEE